MPKLTYKPEGVEPQTWEFSFGRITLGEMGAIQNTLVPILPIFQEQ